MSEVADSLGGNVATLDARPELVFGVAAATGTNLEPFVADFSALLKKYEYEPVSVRLTALLQEHVLETGSVSWQDEGERLAKLMDAGDFLREKLRRGDAMALIATLGITAHRRDAKLKKPAAYVVRQLKHPEEVATLRRVYGDRFFLISLYSTFSERLRHLTGLRNIKDDTARSLMRRDEEDERRTLGQRTRDTFELGDVFFRLDEKNYSQTQTEAERFLDLVFGKPDLSPRLHEHAMYLAYAASLRSADLSRQVGASIITEIGDVLAVGANDVPTAGGGQYWPGKSDKRDHALGYDSNQKHKIRIARDVFERTHPDKKDDHTAFAGFLDALDGSLLFDITEYGRAVHAEMSAIGSCHRNGIRTTGARLFSTTFPCHNCAKHIVDAGLREVQYVEAYPKSQAWPLHSDAIFWEEEDAGTEPGTRVVFKHYVGIGPRRYMDIFSLTISSGRRVKRKKDGNLAPWDRPIAEPRVPSGTASTDLEAVAISELDAAMKGQS